ncbi:hypothetical protein BV899_05845 [Alcaligenes phenolicus]|nr:hypothetical protein BV899_05845 [Alcaligenes phenolicus]
MSPQKREASEKAMQKLDGWTVVDSQRDRKAWAKKILANPAGRSPTVIWMAQQAIGGEKQ